MKPTFLPLALLLTGLAHAQTYTLDPDHTNVNFSVPHMGTSINRGSFSQLTGQVEYDPKARTGSVAISIPVSSLQTNSPHFTEHLKTADFFDAEHYPNVEFKSTKWHFNGNKPSKIDGQLTLLGKSLPVTLTTKQFNCYDSPMLKKRVCGGEFETTIDRTRWGMTKYDAMKQVTLNIQVEAAEQ